MTTVWCTKSHLFSTPYNLSICYMFAKLLLVVDVHTKFQVYSHSKDIRVHILKIAASAAILHLIESGFWQCRCLPGATDCRRLKSQLAKIL